jgi:hypothetical protein
LLLGSTAGAHMAMPAAGSVFDFLKIGGYPYSLNEFHNSGRPLRLIC